MSLPATLWDSGGNPLNFIPGPGGPAGGSTGLNYLAPSNSDPSAYGWDTGLNTELGLGGAGGFTPTSQYLDIPTGLPVTAPTGPAPAQQQITPPHSGASVTTPPSGAGTGPSASTGTGQGVTPPPAGGPSGNGKGVLLILLALTLTYILGRAVLWAR